jgi:hypothetical protein
MIDLVLAVVELAYLFPIAIAHEEQARSSV